MFVSLFFVVVFVAVVCFMRASFGLKCSVYIFTLSIVKKYLEFRLWKSKLRFIRLEMQFAFENAILALEKQEISIQLEV